MIHTPRSALPAHLLPHTGTSLADPLAARARPLACQRRRVHRVRLASTYAWPHCWPRARASPWMPSAAPSHCIDHRTLPSQSPRRATMLSTAFAARLARLHPHGSRQTARLARAEGYQHARHHGRLRPPVLPPGELSRNAPIVCPRRPPPRPSPRLGPNDSQLPNSPA